MICKCGYNSKKSLGRALNSAKKGEIVKIKLNKNGLLGVRHFNEKHDEAEYARGDR